MNTFDFNLLYPILLQTKFQKIIPDRIFIQFFFQIIPFFNGNFDSAIGENVYSKKRTGKTSLIQKSLNMVQKKDIRLLHLYKNGPGFFQNRYFARPKKRSR